MESRSRYPGSFTKPISTDKLLFELPLNSSTGIGVRTKWRGDTVAVLNRQPVRERLARAMTMRRREWKAVFMLFLWLLFPGQQCVWVALKEFRQLSDAAGCIGKLLQCLSQIGRNSRIRTDQDGRVPHGDSNISKGLLCVLQSVGDAVGKRVHTAVNSCQQEAGLVQSLSKRRKGV